VTARAEYQRGIMDAISDPSVEQVVIMSSAQIGKTEILLNVLGYHVAQDPAPLLLLQPTLEMAQAFSKDRLAPMLRDSPALHGLVKDARSRDSGNTMLHKAFPGGHITMAGANSPASLASRPIRVVLCDEVDRYPVSAGTEGDPVTLARRRTANFWNRKVILVSTPGISGHSRIERAYEQSDQRVFLVPCPDCGQEQRLLWKHVTWPDEDRERAEYVCEHCGTLWNDSQRWRAVARGRWEATTPFRGVAGFHISALYSPWTTLAEIAIQQGNALGDTELLKAWVNTSLGETWQDEAERVDAVPLLRRREHYESAPSQVSVVTAGVDVQGDRFEIEWVGWGDGEESWGLRMERLYCDPTTANAWNALEKALHRQFRGESGEVLEARLVCVDSGYLTDEVYKFCARQPGWLIPVKGANVMGKPIVNFPRKRTKDGVYLTEVGTDTAKDLLFQRLGMVDPGPGYCHFPVSEAYDEEYFAQLTGEEKRIRHRRGRAIFEYHAIRARVEALDCRNYAQVAVRILQQHFGVDLSETQAQINAPKSPTVRRRRSSYWS